MAVPHLSIESPVVQHRNFRAQDTKSTTVRASTPDVPGSTYGTSAHKVREQCGKLQIGGRSAT